MIQLNQLSPLKGRKRSKKRVGRGQGSGKGSHTSGRGAKGQKVRGKVHLYFEGGQLPITKRLPHQRGFKKERSNHLAVLKLSLFNVFDDGQEINVETLKEKDLIGIKIGQVKVIHDLPLQKKLVFKGLRFTEGAREEALKSGSTIE